MSARACSSRSLRSSKPKRSALPTKDVRLRRRQRERERRAVEDVYFERELANEIGRLFPACPSERVKEIASHTSRRGSGRIGRTASARALDSAAITLAVAAAARHRESE